MPIFIDCRDYDWSLLCTPPQREFLAERLLIGEGFATFVPIRREFRFDNRVAKARRVKTEKHYPLLPRYIFLGMNEETPSWYSVFRFRVITSVVGIGNVPAKVYHKPLFDLIQRHARGRFNAPHQHRYMQTHREFKVGSTVFTSDGVLRGKVREIQGNMAKVLTRFLGADRIISVPLDNLVSE